MASAPPQKQLELESVRGLASLVVVVAHLVSGFHWTLSNDGLAPPWVRMWFQGGFAVCVFFVLSGYVLSVSYFRQGRLESLQSAAVRRYFRLAIPIAAAVFGSCLLFKSGLYSHHSAAARLGQPANSWMNELLTFEPSWGHAMLEAGWRAVFDYDVATTYVPVLWTMQIEFAGSLLVFSFLALAGNLRNRWLAYVAVGGVLIGLQQKFLLDFLAGIALCDYVQSRDGILRRASWRREGVAIGLVVAGLACSGIHPEWFRQTTGWPWPGVTFGRHAGAFLLLSGVVLSSKLKVVLNARPLVWLGAISFPLYLFHMPLFCSLGTSVYLHLELVANWSRPVAIVAAELSTLAAALVIAEVGRRTVEPLSIGAGRWIDATLFRPRSASLVKSAADGNEAAPAVRIAA